MAEIDREIEALHITGDVPTNEQWEALGQHFTKVRFLKVATGWDEGWIDAKFPLNWPLELLIIADAISERITTPAIMEGRINHLVLLFACGLRFEGPLVKDLMKDAKPFDIIPRNKKPDAETQAEGEMPEDVDAAAPSAKDLPDGIEVYSVPHAWGNWMGNKYEGKEISLSSDHGNGPPSAMKALDILGNDAFQMLTYMALAKFHLLTSLESLTLYSTSDNDLSVVPTMFPSFLPGLELLKEFKITLGSALYATVLETTGGEAFLHTLIPPNIETLRLRGPISATAHLDELAAAFAEADFLPNLKRISIVLDLPDASSEHPREASLEQLRAAHEACKKVLDAATARGVAVEAFEEPWIENYPVLFREVDNRWSVLDSIARS
ncbi:hypothetical protein B0I37DRAFT_384618 [Chaetomium sp. MPI-CAGE-AT-0009]|nr:hypothetical protein B0I37DRAFT_384618 [Chaetomium sp. MPI-CAGE-AT-0009]